MADRFRLRAADIDLDTLQITRDDGTTHRLTRSEAALVRYLRERPGRVIPREELLREVWGYRAGVRSRAVDTAMGRLRNKLERDPAAPDHLITVYGSGYRFDVPALEVPGLFGRAEDMRALVGLAARHRMVTLVGPGGVGKTSLARAWLHRTPEARWLDLSGTRTESDLIGILLAALDGTLGEDDPIQGVLALLTHAPRVLVLDDLDAVTPDAARCLRVWLDGASELRVLATCRHPIGLQDEVVHPLGPLAMTSAAELFVDRARRVDADLTPRPAVVERIVAGLDGLPLAIELVAARLHVLSVDDLGDRIVGFAHRDLTESVQRSWDLLDPVHQRVLRAVALFGATFDAAAVEAVVGDPQVDVLNVLTVLQARCLLQGQRGELRLYSAVRQFVTKQGVAPETVLRWGEWLAQQSGRRWSLDQTVAFERLAARAPDTALRIAWQRVQRHAELCENRAAVAFTDRVLEVIPHGSPREQALGWLSRGMGLRAAGNYAEAIAACERARDAEPEGPLVGQSWFIECQLHMTYGHNDAMEHALDRAEATTDDPDVLLRLASYRANLYRLQGRIDDAVDLLASWMGRPLSGPPTIGRAMLALNYGTALMESGRPDRALAMLTEAGALMETLGRVDAMLLCNANRAEALRCLGQLAKARALYEASVEAIGDGRLPPAVSALMWAQFSALEQETGDLDRAALLANRALLIGGPQDRHRAIARVQLGGVHHERGWTLLAREAYHLAHAQLLEIGDTRFLSLVEARLAALEAACDLDVAQGWLDAARGHVNDDRQLALTHRLYGGHLDLQRGHDVAALLASADTPVPGEPSPSPSAWNPEVRLATRLLQRAREAAS